MKPDPKFRKRFVIFLLGCLCCAIIKEQLHPTPKPQPNTISSGDVQDIAVAIGDLVNTSLVSLNLVSHDAVSTNTVSGQIVSENQVPVEVFIFFYKLFSSYISERGAT